MIATTVKNRIIGAAHAPGGALRVPQASPRKREEGSALIIVILLALVVTALCTTMLITSNTDRMISTNERDSERALFASKSGLNYAFNRYKNSVLTASTAGTSFDSFVTAVSTPLDGGAFTGKLYDISTSTDVGQLYKIVSTGTYKRGTRTTELVFSVIPDALQYGYMAFNAATLHRHTTTGPATFLIQSTIFSNNSVSVPKGVTIDGSIVSSGSIDIADGSPGLVTHVTGDLFSASISTAADVDGKAKLVASVTPTSGAPNVTDNLGNKYLWYSGRSNPDATCGGAGTIAGGCTRYVVQNADPFYSSIFAKNGSLILNPPLNVIKYVAAPKLDYAAMKAEADKNNPTYFTSATAAVTYMATKKVTEVVGGKTMTTVKIGTTAAPEFIYIKGSLDLTVDSTLGADAPSSSKIKADGFYLEGGIYASGNMSFTGRSFTAPAENPPGYDQFHINALPYCYPALVAYDEPGTGTIATWTPADTPAIGGGSSMNMTNVGGSWGGTFYFNGAVYVQDGIHLHHTKDPHDLITFNGAELAYTLHNCDYFHFTYDRSVGCTKFLVSNGGTPQIVSYRELR